jgi:hypothetical protein
VARHALVPPPRPLPRPPALHAPPPSTLDNDDDAPHTTAKHDAPVPRPNIRRATRPRPPPPPQHSCHPSHPRAARARSRILGPRARPRYGPPPRPRRPRRGGESWARHRAASSGAFGGYCTGPEARCAGADG